MTMHAAGNDSSLLVHSAAGAEAARSRAARGPDPALVVESVSPTVRRISPAAQVRRVLRLVRFVGVIGFAVVDGLIRRIERRPHAMRARWLQRHCRYALRALGVVSHVRGESAQPACIVANHLSYLDILVVAAQTPVVFVAKREVASWPVWGRLARTAGTVFVDRTRRGDVGRTGTEMAMLLRTGVSIALFPEGTSTDGSQVLPFKSSLLEPAITAAANLAPVALGYRTPPPYRADRDVCWWGEMTLLPHLWRLLSIPRIEAHLHWGPPMAGVGARKQLASALHATIARGHVEICRQAHPRQPATVHR